MPFVASQLGNMPQSQLDALPLFSADTAAAGGVISIFGGSFTRYWSPTVLGISGAAPAAAGGATFWLASNFLDLRGCRNFTFLLRRFNAAALPQVALPGTVNIYFQMRFTSAEVPLLSQGAAENLSSLGINVFPDAQIVGYFPALQTQGETQTAMWGTSVVLASSAAGANGRQCIGTDVRFLVGFSVAPAVANTFSLALWGSS